MVKYSSELKAEVVSEYLQGDISISLLSKKRNLPRIQVGRWIQNFRLSGADALKRRRVKRSFSVEFKVDVINYYQTHDETLAEVSTKFDVNSCQISLWRTAFNQYGIEALKPHPKGRKTKVKHNKKKLRKLVNKNEIDQLREELTKKNQELYDAKLENEILKKSMTLFGTSKDERKHK
ncbi:helix-turn-helix domain-containing protein [Lactobacillus reuteri]|uniref:helix-turn-helix domain-containing protein n=1 Tax=Limosilactobacillus reuteri TaxID=1598 RepID=UPI00146D602C|nr:helix-turn-helix domain-containing protein [Limosilactobacillus reuteri]NMV49549.1 helix-turn-helix domain-containing protein [Limosilactobacillus reuteri]NMV51206.1 helix-turn-helix domain-containing protein [Limosilactobacillus reuteri]NMV60342.1 helix-turn-helix domain-containing protein [Limosilactobacillus reuteri]NMV62144.1 helix-turn-helix domain-containing protein [Limosilactobacillus reuteri]NMV63919.1 helix-turn-helix domain-containing protein [Limosilactobacillus reuteri]